MRPLADHLVCMRSRTGTPPPSIAVCAVLSIVLEAGRLRASDTAYSKIKAGDSVKR
jgi:hypothetical protein